MAEGASSSDVASFILVCRKIFFLSEKFPLKIRNSRLKSFTFRCNLKAKFANSDSEHAYVLLSF